MSPYIHVTLTRLRRGRVSSWRFFAKAQNDKKGSKKDMGKMSHRTKIILVGLLISLGLAAIVSPFASSLPDGLEWVAEKLGFIEKKTQIVKAPLPDYGMPIVKNTRISTAVAGIVGTMLVFCITMLLMLAVKKKGKSP